MISASVWFPFPPSTHPERGFHRPTDKKTVSTDPKVLLMTLMPCSLFSSEAYEMRGKWKVKYSEFCP